MDGKLVGEVTHFYSHLDVAVVKLKAELKKKDRIKIKGHTTDLEQLVESMQLDHIPVEKAAKGKEIGLKVKGRVREGDQVFRGE